MVRRRVVSSAWLIIHCVCFSNRAPGMLTAVCRGRFLGLPFHGTPYTNMCCRYGIYDGAMASGMVHLSTPLHSASPSTHPDLRPSLPVPDVHNLGLPPLLLLELSLPETNAANGRKAAAGGRGGHEAQDTSLGLCAPRRRVKRTSATLETITQSATTCVPLGFDLVEKPDPPPPSNSSSYRTLFRDDDRRNPPRSASTSYDA